MHKFISTKIKKRVNRRLKHTALVTQQLALDVAGAVAEIQEERSRIEGFISAISDVISVVDTDFRILYQNDSCKQALGEHVGEQCFSAYHNRKTVCDGCFTVSAFRSGTTQQGEREVLFANGGCQQMEFSVSPLRDASGRIVAAIELIRDITERKHAEWQLACNNAVSRILAESSTVESAVPRVLEAICRAIGWDVGEIWWVNERKHCLRLYSLWHRPELDITAFETVSMQLSFGPSEGLPGRVWTSGEEAWVRDIPQDGNFPRCRHARDCGLNSAFAFPVILGGMAMGVMGFFSRSVREPNPGLLKAMIPLGIQLGQLMERKEAERSLRESERRFRETLENIHLLAIELDSSGTIIFCNDFALHLTGWKREELLGRNWFEILSPDHNLLASYEEWISLDTMPVHYENTIITKNGETRLIAWNITVLYDTNGAVIGTACIGKDITEQRKAQEELIHLSSHDALTGLYNRMYFEEELKRLSQGRKFPVSIITIDLDGLKTVNDTQGHDSGDRMIRMAAQVLLGAFRAGDMLARIGGDEFCILLPETGLAEADEAVNRIRRQVQEATAGVGGLCLRMSIGVATAHEASELFDALKQSDMRMYQDKFAHRAGQPPEPFPAY